MSPRLAFRLAAIGFAALAILLAALQGARSRSSGTPAAAPTPAPGQIADPTLRHCQRLGEAGAQDPACLQAWADERARFLGAGRSPRQPGA